MAFSQPASSSVEPPAHAVPTELLHEIFGLVAGDDSEGHGVGHGDLCKLELPAFELSQVCSRWRNEALSLPQLWSNPFIKLKGTRRFNEKNFSRATEISRFSYLFARVIERLGSLPLHIDIELDLDEEYVVGHSDALEVPPVLWVHSDVVPYFCSNLRWLEGKLPILEQFRVNMPHWDVFVPPFPWSVQVFEQAPLLRSVTLEDTDPVRVHLPWNQLQTIKLSFGALESQTIRSTLIALQGAPSLENLYILFDTSHSLHGDILSEDLVIHVPNLHIHFEGSASSITPFYLSVFKRLQIPDLTDLELSECTSLYELSTHRHSDDPIPIDKIKPFLTHSTITTFSWMYLKTTAAEFLGLLKVLSTLVVLKAGTLHVDEYGTILDDPFFPSLQILSDSTPIVPRLERLEIISHMDLQFPHSALIAMVSSRLVAGSNTSRLLQLKLELPNQRVAPNDLESYREVSKSLGVEMRDEIGRLRI